ncbi:MAG TPA: hypothetical protein VIX19_12690 [Terriglobales bacterium]
MISSIPAVQPASACEHERAPLPSRWRWSLVVAVNNDSVLSNTLLASPVIGERCQVIAKRGFPCAGQAYNSGLADAQHDVVVFAHQDVYLPQDWLTNLECALAQLSIDDPNWGVLGAFGVTKKHPVELLGYCYSTGLKRVLGAPFAKPILARSLDEMVLVVRRSSRLAFDERLPGFHLYGTDICLEAEARGISSYVVSAFCIHNANGIRYLPADFWRAYFYLRRKRWRALPVTTCCTTITKWCLPVAQRVAVELTHRLRRPDVGVRCDEMSALYRHVMQMEQGRCPGTAALATPRSGSDDASVRPLKKADHVGA